MNKKRFKPNKRIQKAVNNLNKTELVKYGFAPEHINFKRKAIAIGCKN